MKTNIFDLTGKVVFCNAESCGNDEVSLTETLPLRDLLIYPRNTNSNRTPYLQNYQFPEIDDLVDQEGKWDYSNSYFLEEILSGNIDESKKAHLENYFNYQIGLLNNFEENNANILLVPDDYDAEKQEKLLRGCGLPRNNTLLLWRSVAVGMGCEEKLFDMGAKENDRVAIIDLQSSKLLNISILTLKKDQDSQGNEKLVFARSAFKNQDKYPKINDETSATITDNWSLWNRRNIDQTEEFWRHTWHFSGKNIIPTIDGNWQEKEYIEKNIRYLHCLTREPEKDIDFFIVSGKVEVGFLGGIPDEKIIIENCHENFAVKGAGRFSVRNAHDLPTYFDECESLHFVFQDANAVKVTTKELIHGDEFCRGGRHINGEKNQDFFLEKDKKEITFFMHVGDITEDTQLKELKHEFNHETTQNQPLTLYPSMIPGQGIARVLVEAPPLLSEHVELDFLRMKLSFDKDSHMPQTIKSLQAKLPLSFPVDFPEAEASMGLYCTYCAKHVEDFLKGHKLPNNCFAHTSWPDMNKGGVEAFRRINVFGTKAGHEYPILDIDLLHQVFKKIADKYDEASGSPYWDIQQGKFDYLRLAAWTYRCGRKEFKNIIDDTLQRIEAKSQNPKNKVKQQEFTVCSNMLSVSEQHNYIIYFINYTTQIINQEDNYQGLVTGVDWWIRALMGILIYSNNVLEKFPSEKCEMCMENLFSIWKSYVQNGKSESYINKVTCCMLFLLRRRKYDHQFLRESNGELYARIMACENDFRSPLAHAFFDYMRSKGSIDIPLGDILGDD